jgi:Calcineurin-like phosphoesterase
LEYKGFKLVKKAHGVVELVTDKELVVLAIPDTHAPYHHKDIIKFLSSVKKEFKPDVVVHLGDEADFEPLGFHGKNPDMPSAKDDYYSALEHLGELYKLFPDVLVCHSNHTSRPYRVAFAAGLPSQMVKTYAELLRAPKGWSWHDRIIINNVCYIHGDPKSGANATRAWMNENRMSTVHGHIHGHGGVCYSASPFKQIFGMNAGCLIDLEAIAFKYGAKYANKGTLGCGIIRGGKEAHFIPMRYL